MLKSDENAGEAIRYHFADVSKMITMPNSAEKEIDEILTKSRTQA